MFLKNPDGEVQSIPSDRSHSLQRISPRRLEWNEAVVPPSAGARFRFDAHADRAWGPSSPRQPAPEKARSISRSARRSPDHQTG